MCPITTDAFTCCQTFNMHVNVIGGGYNIINTATQFVDSTYC